MNFPRPQGHVTFLTQDVANLGSSLKPLVLRVFIGAQSHTAHMADLNLQPFLEIRANAFSLHLLQKLEQIFMS